MTRVQELKDEIYLIQSSCSHRWIKDHEVTPLESLVSGVYVGHAAGPIQLEVPISEGEHFGFRATCSGCSKEFKGHISTTCPKCFTRLKEQGMAPYQRETYFGISYIYYGIMLKFCPQCHLRVACDEWDQ